MINAGVIGLGVGQRHLLALCDHPRVGRVLAYDIDAARLAEVGAQCRAELAADGKSILADPDLDLVVIASYDEDHFDEVMTALAHGKHVFVEKPICVNRQQLNAIRAAYEAGKSRLGSNLILRKVERFIALRDRIRAGELGDVYRVDAGYWYGRLFKLTEGWRGRQKHYSVTLGGGIHLLDLLLFLFGGRMEVVHAVGNRHSLVDSNLTIASCVVATLRTPSGCIVQLTTDYGSVYPHYHDLRVFGTEGVFLNGIDTAAYSMGRARDNLKDDLSAYPARSKADLLLDFVDEILDDRCPSVDVGDIFHAAELAIEIENRINDSVWEASD